MLSGKHGEVLMLAVLRQAVTILAIPLALVAYLWVGLVGVVLMPLWMPLMKWWYRKDIEAERSRYHRETYGYTPKDSTD
jgi:hypothetical protein